MTTPTYRCPACKDLVDPIREGDDLVSFCCDEVCERVWLCETCGEREAHTGCDECFECLLDAAIEDPSTISCCHSSLQAEIARGLAERSRVDTATVPAIRLTIRQAS